MEQKLFMFGIAILVVLLLQVIDTVVAKSDPRDCEGK